jgi:hypothetical protein
MNKRCPPSIVGSRWNGKNEIILRRVEFPTFIELPRNGATAKRRFPKIMLFPQQAER